jgi:hypothetical protein
MSDCFWPKFNIARRRSSTLSRHPDQGRKVATQ